MRMMEERIARGEDGVDIYNMLDEVSDLWYYHSETRFFILKYGNIKIFVYYISYSYYANIIKPNFYSQYKS